nr:GNAT family N-acetyltransferase [Kribbella sandramycini]
MAKHRPTTPHLYLAAMAVLPQHRNQGLGTALLRHRLATTSLPTYLEASTPQAAALYARHDFHPLPQIALPQGPTLHPMLRPA